MPRFAKGGAANGLIMNSGYNILLVRRMLQIGDSCLIVLNKA